MHFIIVADASAAVLLYCTGFRMLCLELRGTANGDEEIVLNSTEQPLFCIKPESVNTDMTNRQRYHDILYKAIRDTQFILIHEIHNMELNGMPKDNFSSIIKQNRDSEVFLCIKGRSLKRPVFF